MIDPELSRILQERIVTQGELALSEKDVEVLETILRSETMLKVLGNLAAQARGLGNILLTAELHDTRATYHAARAQGIYTGVMQSIESLIGYVTEKEDEEVDENES